MAGQLVILSWLGKIKISEDWEMGTTMRNSALHTEREHRWFVYLVLDLVGLDVLTNGKHTCIFEFQPIFE